MESHIEQALHALYKGDRSEVERLLRRSARTGQELWLLASAVEDDEQRFDYLERVVHSRQQPYADMAAAILARERDFAEEMERAPGWQLWLLKHRSRLIAFMITVAVIALTALVILWIFTPPGDDPDTIRQREAASATQAAFQATADILALTPAPTPSITPLPVAAQRNVSYPPHGMLRIINYEYPSTLPIGRNGRLEPENGQFSYAAIQFEFTCGAGYENRAFCDNPPQVRDIRMVYNNGNEEPFGGHTVIGTQFPNNVPVGVSARGWLAFPVPNGWRPVELILVVSGDPNAPGGQTTSEVRLQLP